MLPTASPDQLRACAKWHERQAHRNPGSAKRHYGIADTLRAKANAVIRMFSGSVNPPRAEVLAGYSKQQFLQGA